MAVEIFLIEIFLNIQRMLVTLKCNQQSFLIMKICPFYAYFFGCCLQNKLLLKKHIYILCLNNKLHALYQQLQIYSLHRKIIFQCSSCVFLDRENLRFSHLYKFSDIFYLQLISFFSLEFYSYQFDEYLRGVSYKAITF